MATWQPHGALSAQHLQMDRCESLPMLPAEPLTKCVHSMEAFGNSLDILAFTLFKSESGIIIQSVSVLDAVGSGAAVMAFCSLNY